MKYLSTTEVSKKWGIGRRRIEILCASDRVPGAALVGNTWIIPEDAEKPERKKREEKPPQPKPQPPLVKKLRQQKTKKMYAELVLAGDVKGYLDTVRQGQ